MLSLKDSKEVNGPHDTDAGNKRGGVWQSVVPARFGYQHIASTALIAHSGPSGPVAAVVSHTWTRATCRPEGRGCRHRLRLRQCAWAHQEFHKIGAADLTCLVSLMRSPLTWMCLTCGLGRVGGMLDPRLGRSKSSSP
jgi:hypothetical protein